MRVKSERYRTIWEKSETCVCVIDQRHLPHKFIVSELTSVEEFAFAIGEMQVRGAPLIGATAAYGMYIAALEAARNDSFDESIAKSARKLLATRPTAVNLQWAIDKQTQILSGDGDIETRIKDALETAREIVEEDVQNSKKIGEYGADIIEEIFRNKKDVVNILTHCNAGWLATIDYGTATAPMYIARDRGIRIHIWVDETRPRNQGAKLTAWELYQEGIDNTLIVDNAGGHIMQNGLVDIVIVGSDRTTYTGDVANKIGTYLKALAAKDNGIPFYVAVPSSSIDFKIADGVKEIPIEQRNPNEIKYVDGWLDGDIKEALIPNKESRAANYAFDVTPSRLVTSLITERGVCEASERGVRSLFPERF